MSSGRLQSLIQGLKCFEEYCLSETHNCEEISGEIFSKQDYIDIPETLAHVLQSYLLL